MSLTDIIYQELLNGLRTGLDYDQIRQKHENSKGPFYNALQRVFTAVSAEICSLSSQSRQLQSNVADSKSKVEALSQQHKEAENSLRNKKQEMQSWEKQVEAARKQLAALDKELNTKAILLDQLRELEKMGFDHEKLKYMQGRIVDIGTRRGLKPKDAISRFFEDLKDYDVMIGFQRELQRLESIAETMRLEADKWRSEKENLETSHKELEKVINAVDFLLKQGIKPEQLISWSKVLQKVGGIERLESELNEYKSIKEIVNAENKSIERLGLRKQGLEGEVNTLKEQKEEIEGAIKSLSEYGTTEITGVKDKAVFELVALIEELRAETTRLVEAKAEAAKLEREMTYAMYFRADDKTLGTASKEVAELLLATVAKWYKLRGLALRFDVPDFLSRKYLGLYAYDRFDFLDLIRWIQGGLDKYEEDTKFGLVRRA
jgi:peptidoglycan hydrolase CwlO-like protein